MIRLSVLFLLILGCRSGSKTTDFACIPDSIFLFKNLESSIPLKEFEYDRHSKILIARKPLFEADSVRKQKLLEKFLTNGFPPWMYNVHFVSKQQMIGEYQPIISRVGGTDYLTSMMLLLDANCNPISNLILEGKNCEGVFETDSTIMLCPVQYNRFYRNRIESKEIKTIEYLNSDKVLIDSILYISEIDSRGQFKTTLQDSIRTIFYRKNNRNKL